MMSNFGVAITCGLTEPVLIRDCISTWMGGHQNAAEELLSSLEFWFCHADWCAVMETGANKL